MARIVVSGRIDTDPRLVVTIDGFVVAGFLLRGRPARAPRVRSASAHRPTYVVSAFGALARTVGVDLRRGQRVVVRGRLVHHSTAAGDVHLEIVADHLRTAPWRRPHPEGRRNDRPVELS